MTSEANPGPNRGRTMRRAAASSLNRLRSLRARRRMWLRVAQVLAVVAVVVGGLLGGAVFRLSQGPVSVGFLTPRIVDAMQKQLPPEFTARVADTVIERDGSSGEVLLRLRDVSVLGPDGVPVFAAPRAAIGLSGGGLLVGNVTPRSVFLIRPALTVIEENGRLRMKAGADPAAGEPEPPAKMVNPVEAFAVLFAVLGQNGQNGAPALTSIGARGASLSVARSDGTTGTLQQIDVSAERGDEPGAVTVSVGLGRKTGAPLLTASLRRRDDGSFAIGGNIENVALSDIAPLVPGGLPFDMTGPISGRLDAFIDASGGFDNLSVNLTLGAGHVGKGDKRILVDEADLSFDWRYATGAINIGPSHVLIGNSRGTVSGQIAVPSRGDFSYGTVPVRLDFTDIVLDDPDTGVPAIYDSIALEAFFVSAQRVLHISRMDVAGAGTAGSFVGFIGGGGESPGIRLAGSMTPTSVETFKSVWPPFIADKARRWFVNHVLSGQIIGGRVDVDIRPGEIARVLRGVPFHREAFDLGFSLKDGSLLFLKEMPPLLAVNADGRVDAQEFTALTTTVGRVDLPDGGSVSVPSGRFFVPDIPAKPSSGELTFELDGSIGNIMRLLDYPPIELAKRRNFDIDSFGGEGAFEFTLRMPLIDGLRFSDFDLAADGSIAGFSAENFAGAKSIGDGSIDVRVADGRVLIEGDALVDNVRADLALDDSLDPSGAPGARSVTMTLDEAARARLGMPLDAILTGPIVTTVSDVKATESGNVQQIEADLTQASVSFPALGLEKPAGQPATANFKLTQSGQTVKLTDLRVQSESLRVEGSAEFSKAGGLVSLNMPVLRTPRGTDLAVSGTSQSGARSFKLKGKALDMRALLANLGEAAENSGDSGSEVMNVEIDVGRAIGVGGEILSNLQGTVRRVGNRTNRLDLSAVTSNAVPVSIRYSDDGTNSDLSVDSADAGRVLAWVGYYPNMRGGQLRVVAGRRGATAPLSGDIAIDRFRIANDPSLARLIEGGEDQPETLDRPSAPAQPAGGGAQRVNVADVGFDRLSAKFVRGKGDLKVQEGVLRGVAVGATFEGTIDFDDERMNLHGTYVPLYALNNLFGQLPLFLGPLLGGKKNEGLLGITYSLSGSTRKPVLTINPISVVAPGVFRYILGMDNPQAPARPDGDPPPARTIR
ncbi:hypothetical protein [Microbaculum sp. FT89]|uniref:hypothetical protein n=1 Tax=Microbaculum sp. FT89 TaxID=3447298 RepID=UPI003F529F32